VVSYYDVVAHESARGTVTIVADVGRLGLPRRKIKVFKPEYGSIAAAKDWLRKHAPRGHCWNCPDGSRVVVTRRVERTSDGRPVYLSTSDLYAPNEP
jgi:hypothetical protein